MRISRITAAEVLDSRGNPTVEASVVLEDGNHGFGARAFGSFNRRKRGHGTQRWRRK